MKNFKIYFLSLAVAFGATFSTVSAQEEEESSFMDVGMDVYSSYIWRGAKFGNGAAFQPYLEASFGNFAVGAWGSANTGSISFSDSVFMSGEAFEADLYLSYSFDFGLSIAVTDYYFGGDWKKFDENHYIEPALSYEIGDFSFLGAYMFTPDFEDGDTYLEAAYSIGGVLDLAVGVGDGAYTSEGDFSVCNISLGTSKEIAITEKFALPVSGSVTLNPSTGGFYVAAGVSF